MKFSESGGAHRVGVNSILPSRLFYLGTEEVDVIIVGVIYGVACKSYMHYDITYLAPSTTTTTIGMS